MRTGGCCRTVDRETSRFPHKERLHMPGSLTTPDRPGARNGASGRVAFRKMHCVGIQNRKLSRLNGWPMRPPVNASPRPSRAPAHELGADVDRYSFIARDLHPLLLAGLPAHAFLFRFAPVTGPNGMTLRCRRSANSGLCRRSRNGVYGKSSRSLRPRLHPCGLMLAARITLPHLSVSSAISLPN